MKSSELKGTGISEEQDSDETGQQSAQYSVTAWFFADLTRTQSQSNSLQIGDG